MPNRIKREFKKTEFATEATHSNGITVNAQRVKKGKKNSSGCLSAGASFSLKRIPARGFLQLRGAQRTQSESYKGLFQIAP